MSPEAEELLQELISKMDIEAHVYCANMQSIAFQELEENNMFSKVDRYFHGDGCVRLSTKALHYLEEKKTEQRRQEEQRLKEKKAKKSNLMHDVGLVILGAILSFLFQLIASVLFPKL